MKKYKKENCYRIISRKIMDYNELVEVLVYRMRLYEEEFRLERKVPYYTYQITKTTIMLL